jgi:hypothetical protein
MSIPTRTIGTLSVSAIGLGCMGMSFAYGPTDRGESLATLHRALDLGVTFFDTAAIYGQGHNETLVGRALGALPHDWDETFGRAGRALGDDAERARRLLAEVVFEDVLGAVGVRPRQGEAVGQQIAEPRHRHHGRNEHHRPRGNDRPAITDHRAGQALQSAPLENLLAATKLVDATEERQIERRDSFRLFTRSTFLTAANQT